MTCANCNCIETQKGYLILDSGAKFRVLYCWSCEHIQRLGNSAPDVKKSYKGSFVRKFAPQKKGGEK